ncbi:hypothetical protein GCM10020000_32540 [Streptomyces olivoverticillatus]
MSDSQWVSSSMPYLTPKSAGAADAWSAETAALGRRGTQRIVHAGEVPAPPVVAGLLGVPEGETVVVRRRLMLLDGLPNELTDTYYPAGIACGTPLLATAKIPGGAITLLAELGYAGGGGSRGRDCSYAGRGGEGSAVHRSGRAGAAADAAHARPAGGGRFRWT